MNPLIPLIFFFLLSIHPITTQNLIAKSCRNITQADPNVDYAFCVTSLQAAPASTCASLRGLGMMAIRLIRYNITDTRCHVKQMMRSRKWDPYVKQCLDDCLELFSDAGPTVKKAMRHYNAKRFNDANVQISAIMDYSMTCEDGFSEKKGVVSPITKRNGDMFQLSAMALSIMSMVQSGSSSGCC